MRWWIALGGLLLIAPHAACAKGCTFTVAPISFGSYPPFSAIPTDTSGSVGISCNGVNGTYTVAVDAGLYGGGNFFNRKVSAGGYQLSYQLYTDAAHSAVWGDGTAGTGTVSGTCHSKTCTPGTNIVYARMPALQIATPGSYSDTITVTVSY